MSHMISLKIFDLKLYLVYVMLDKVIARPVHGSGRNTTSFMSSKECYLGKMTESSFLEVQAIISGRPIVLESQFGDRESTQMCMDLVSSQTSEIEVSAIFKTWVGAVEGVYRHSLARVLNINMTNTNPCGK